MSQTNNTNTETNTQPSARAIAWQRYMLKRENSLPDWLIKNSIVFFFISLFACWVAWGHVPNYDVVFTIIISIVLFFLVGKSMSNKFSLLRENIFLRSVFTVGFIVRILWVLYMFFIFNPRHYGTRHGDGADTDWFMAFGRNLSEWLSLNSTHSLAEIIDINMSAIDDVAYPMILGIEYLLTGGISDVLIPFIIKSILGACCAIYAYHIAKRHFGEGTARIAAIFVCLNPNIIYWCGTMMKEAEMVFFCCLAVDKFDEALSSGQRLTLRALLPGLLAGLVLLFMRTAIGLALFMGVFVHIVFASRRIISIGKKIIIGILIVVTLSISVGDRILAQSQGYLNLVQTDAQEKNMEWRSKYGGNAFAKYAGAAVFAPLIFTIPFPTFNVANDIQYTQMQLSGGSFIKNILSFFVIIVLVQFLLTGEWRKHVFIIAYTCAYLCILVFSAFAQSGRFHMPVWPMLMIFAAYGLQQAKSDKKMRRWFTYVLYMEVFVCLAWNWFKLAGRGMI